MATYKQAVQWIAANDDCYWLGDYDGHGPIMSVTACFVRDLWDKTDEKVLKDIRRELKKVYPNHDVFKETNRHA